jgi:hypothetical protein
MKNAQKGNRTVAPSHHMPFTPGMMNFFQPQQRSNNVFFQQQVFPGMMSMMPPPVIPVYNPVMNNGYAQQPFMPPQQFTPMNLIQPQMNQPVQSFGNQGFRPPVQQQQPFEFGPSQQNGFGISPPNNFGYQPAQQPQTFGFGQQPVFQPPGFQQLLQPNGFQQGVQPGVYGQGGYNNFRM